ncbi:alkaline phosphatase D family protein [Haladaptatus sp. AB618]|uniref:alkaline phosphatase D family protein n=1 Tax=Haladaptatus sp. AB618 TaxID=2934173 RepID=UPI00209C4BA9|nr:alkaline phosphatase D family protein [Haladaptatus sp. AB618]MCO8256068.1 alkaline phosphatase D family protein [Haladaptatus sp. AB618]
MVSKNNAYRKEINRRGFFRSVAGTTAAGGLSTLLAKRAIAQPTTPVRDGSAHAFSYDAAADADATFPQSVMSGGPTDSGAIVWTRIAEAAYREGQPVGVQVANDETFDDPAFEGVVDASTVSATHDYTVKVDLDGELDADRFYYYRFIYDGTASRTGRLRTMPSADQHVDDLSFGVVTCQDYQNGYYGAFHHIANESIDYVVHLGDFIYESSDGAYVSPTGEIKPGRDFDLPSGASLAESLDDFRFLYKKYKSDPLLQEALERHTLIAGWDDHEIGNNRYWDYATDAPVLPNKDDGSKPSVAMEITANGIQAWIEHMPMRVEYDPSEEDLHEQLRLWRRFEFGDLVDLVVTDERLFRDGPPCEDRTLTCTNEDDPDRTMLGSEQKSWFVDSLSESSARWTTWANEVLTMPLTAGEDWYQVEFLEDSWDGFQAERAELMNAVDDASLRNFITLTGDLHCSMAGYQHAGYGEVSWNRDTVGIEFMTPSITSVCAADVVDFPGDWDREALAAIAKAENEHLEYINWYEHGYSVVEFTETDCEFTVYGVDADENSADAEKRTLAQYRVPDGELSLEALSEPKTVSRS